ncbi:hypothetical protein CEXT_427811 [Caerostris extrusa]|uniref:Uncharacterized protein n=1 Tax=Caerostris extrusa TaxID=172846 RepID=A0AAV4XCS2_CAEEX|nr:hypothetical protein CEXT_427811 [Caerostris extrusa]
MFRVLSYRRSAPASVTETELEHCPLEMFLYSIESFIRTLALERRHSKSRRKIIENELGVNSLRACSLYYTQYFSCLLLLQRSESTEFEKFNTNWCEY